MKTLTPRQNRIEIGSIVTLIAFAAPFGSRRQHDAGNRPREDSDISSAPRPKDASEPVGPTLQARFFAVRRTCSSKNKPGREARA